MLKITLHIPDRTVELENSRSPETMDLDDLLWCFSVRISFVDPVRDSPFLVLPEVLLFDFLQQLSGVRRWIVGKTDQSSATIDDKEGAYFLIFEEHAGVVTVKDKYKGQLFQLPAANFLASTEEFISKAFDEAELKFPTLKDNPYYRDLISQIKESIAMRTPR